MFSFKKGNIFDSNAQALVNTVNFEGYMGKGIAYQFKQLYPKSNIDYVRAIDNDELFLGKLHYFYENDKIIINFPTKIKWREKSKLEYISIGLDQLYVLINELDIKSIAIPPLGCGNGGLFWPDVKNLIINKLESVSQDVDIVIFEPSVNMDTNFKKEPILDSNALILMEIKSKLKKFNRTRLMIATYYANYYSKYKYFDFTYHNETPFDKNVELISVRIKEFQKFYNVYSIYESQLLLKNKLISKTVESKFLSLDSSIIKGCNLVNSFENDTELKDFTTVFFIIERNEPISFEEILTRYLDFKDLHSEASLKPYILNYLNIMEQKKIIKTGMLGILINS